MNAVFGGTRLRLVGWSVLVVGVIQLAIGTILYLMLTRALVDSVDATLVTNSQIAQVELTETGKADELEREGYRGGLFYLVLDSSGAVTDNPQQVDLEGLPGDLAQANEPQFRTLNTMGQAVRIYVRQVAEPDSGPAILVVGQSLQAMQTAAQQLLMVMLAGVAIGLLLAFAGAWFLADRALVPIRRAFQRQQEFVADASHELRTPLTILHAATDVLDQHADEPMHANREVLDEVRREIVRMERLTRDLLTLARSDRGELRLSLGQVDLGALARALERRVSVLAQARGIDLEVQLEGPTPVIEGDPDRLEQVGLIVLDNALNHTPRGGHIRILVRRQQKEGLFSVEDTGEGIPSEHLTRVFDRFQRVDPSRSRDTGGAGLGLAIAQSLITAHGGSIEIGTGNGGGARVTIHLPLSESPEPPVVQAPDARSREGVDRTAVRR